MSDFPKAYMLKGDDSVMVVENSKDEFTHDGWPLKEDYIQRMILCGDLVEVRL